MVRQTVRGAGVNRRVVLRRSLVSARLLLRAEIVRQSQQGERPHLSVLRVAGSVRLRRRVRVIDRRITPDSREEKRSARPSRLPLKTGADSDRSLLHRTTRCRVRDRAVAGATAAIGIGPRRALRRSAATRKGTDVDRHVHSLTCASRLSGRRRTVAEDIVRRVTVVRAVCPAMEALTERLATGEVEAALRAVAEVDTTVVVGADTLAEVGVVVARQAGAVATLQVEAGATTEDTARGATRCVELQ